MLSSCTLFLDLDRLDRDFLLECDLRLRCDLDLDRERCFLDGLSVDLLLLLLSPSSVSFFSSSSLSSSLSSLSSTLSGDGVADPDLLLWEEPDEWEEREDDLGLGGMSNSCKRKDIS